MLIRVLIADDHTLVRTGMRVMLDAAAGIKVVGEAASGEEAIRKVRELSPHVVLMDVNMPGIGGLEATSRLLAISPGIRILIVTVYDDSLYSSHLLQAGALGYVTKGATEAEMERAVRTVHMGQRYISPCIASKLAIRHLKSKKGTSFESLSPREFQIAKRVVHGRTTDSIAEELSLSPKTVNSYRYRIFEKFDVDNNVLLTHLAIQHGILEKHPLPEEE